MTQRKIPLLSVVIPTAGRPELLPRAIESALSAAPEGDVEVIVVPNGPDPSWRSAMTAFGADSRVRSEPIETAHANVARNRGLALASGKYVRFLDDDDYLLPPAAEQSGSDLCSGLLLNVDTGGSLLGTLGFPDTSDFVCAAVSVSGFRLPVGNLFRRETISDCRWNEAVNRAQDYVWMIELATRREWTWVHVPDHVGVWFQHDAARTTTMRLSSDHPVQVIDALLELWRVLARDHRLTETRSNAIADALWHAVHRHFPYYPIYWHRVARQARWISPRTRRPHHPIFERWPFVLMNPLLLQWAVLPLRRLGVDVERFGAGRGERVRAEIGDAEYLLLYVGRLVDKKGVDDLIRAYALLDAALRDRTQLWIIGSGDCEARACGRSPKNFTLRREFASGDA